MSFYNDLLGPSAPKLCGIDIQVVGEGKTLGSQDYHELVRPITFDEINQELHTIHSLKAPGIVFL